MKEAYKLWKEGKTIINKAAKLCGFPQQTLRDQSYGLVDPIKFKSGPDRSLGSADEAALVSYVKEVAALGYKVTRKWLTDQWRNTFLLEEDGY